MDMPRMTSRRFAPIGVFDSGVGGLTVLERLLAIPDLRGEEFVQLADIANIHYGSYAKTGATGFLRELVVRDVLFLLNDGFFASAAEDRPSGVKTPAKIIVVGCNTAIAYGLDAVKATLAAIGSPARIVNIVECGARAAIRSLGGISRKEAVVGILSTPGTFASGVYPAAIAREAAEAGFHAPPLVVARGCDDLADAIQFGRHDLGAIVGRFLRELVVETAAKGRGARLCNVVFGCSHYALALPQFRDALDELRRDPATGKYIAEDFAFVDPAKETAAECRDLLAQDDLLAGRDAESSVSMFVSSPLPNLPKRLVALDGTLEDGYKYMRRPGRFVVDTVFVPLHEGVFDRGHFKSLLDVLPHVAKSLEGKW